MKTRLLDANQLSLAQWTLDELVNSLAAAVADAAITDLANVPGDLLACYHDACCLQARVHDLHQRLSNEVMQQCADADAEAAATAAVITRSLELV